MPNLHEKEIRVRQLRIAKYNQLIKKYNGDMGWLEYFRKQKEEETKFLKRLLNENKELK